MALNANYRDGSHRQHGPWHIGFHGPLIFETLPPLFGLLACLEITENILEEEKQFAQKLEAARDCRMATLCGQVHIGVCTLHLQIDVRLQHHVHLPVLRVPVDQGIPGNRVRMIMTLSTSLVGDDRVSL
jgi:hypothetical protein